MKTLQLINAIEREAKDRAETADTKGYLDKMLNLVYAALIYEELSEANKLLKIRKKSYQENDELAAYLIKTFCKKNIAKKLQAIPKILVVNCDFQTVRDTVKNSSLLDSQQSFSNLRDDSILARMDFRNAHSLLFKSNRKIIAGN